MNALFASPTGGQWLPYREKPRTNAMELTDLREGDRYEFRVFAENQIGLSKPSESCMPFTAKSKYGQDFVLFRNFLHTWSRSNLQEETSKP